MVSRERLYQQYSKILGTFINQNQDIRINHYVWSGDLVAGKTATLGTFALPDGATQLVGMLLTPRGSVHISLMWDGRTVYLTQKHLQDILAMMR